MLLRLQTSRCICDTFCVSRIYYLYSPSSYHTTALIQKETLLVFLFFFFFSQSLISLGIELTNLSLT